jgi:hypothetical protein
VDVEIAIRRGTTPPSRGTLSIALNFTEGLHLTAKEAHGDARFRAALEHVRRFYAGAGIDVALVFRDVARGVDVDDIGRELPSSRAELLRESIPGAANVFFVPAHEDMGVSGVAGGIPGPALAATASSGVVVRGNRDTASSALGYVIAHEVGHFLGLWHTVEGRGGWHLARSPLRQFVDDEFVPPDDLAEPAVPVLDGEDVHDEDLLVDTSPRDLGNVMHWSNQSEGFAPFEAADDVPGLPGVLFTEEQARVMLRHPLVKVTG